MRKSKAALFAVVRYMRYQFLPKRSVLCRLFCKHDAIGLLDTREQQSSIKPRLALSNIFFPFNFAHLVHLYNKYCINLYICKLMDTSRSHLRMHFIYFHSFINEGNFQISVISLALPLQAIMIQKASAKGHRWPF